tara:strand:+ start:18569 stop:18715 length:147 start_codon:yes stop_codon:yes gene_type:complete
MVYAIEDPQHVERFSDMLKDTPQSTILEDGKIKRSGFYLDAVDLVAKV